MLFSTLAAIPVPVERWGDGRQLSVLQRRWRQGLRATQIGADQLDCGGLTLSNEPQQQLLRADEVVACELHA